MQLSLQLSKLQGTTSYFDGNMGRVGVKSDTVPHILQIKYIYNFVAHYDALMQINVKHVNFEEEFLGKPD